MSRHSRRLAHVATARAVDLPRPTPHGTDGWPSLPYEEWRATRDTLHMYTQVVGKLRLALSPFEPGWANVALYVTARGLTTSPIPFGTRTFDAEFDFAEHVLVMRTSDGLTERQPLGGAVADFYRNVMQALHRMSIDVEISAVPSEVADPIPFPEDRVHVTYEPAHAARFHQVLSIVDVVMKQHRAHFRGRSTPVHFFWGTFDVALTRYSERRVTPPEGAGIIERFGGDTEEICAGWWPGDERVSYPAFYAYAYPVPEDIEGVSTQLLEGAWDATAGEFLLPYESVRTRPDPERGVMAFLESSYAGAAALLGWSDELTHFDAPPNVASTPRTSPSASTSTLPST